MKSEQKLINDEIDLISLISVFFDNFNIIFSIFLTSVLSITIFYFSTTSEYSSNALLEIKGNDTSFLPQSLTSGLSITSSNQESLKAENEIYKSDNTIKDAIEKLKLKNFYEFDEIPTANDVRNNLSIKNSSTSLMEINYVNTNRTLTKDLLDLLNEEFINDRRDFIKQSSSAGRKFIQSEIPRIKELLKKAEDNLNSFKISTNTSDVIFDTNTRILKLEELKSRYNDIVFKELELKEFYKENHPIYLTLSEQKNLVLSQINEIEEDLPNVPSTQRTLENFKREVEIYSNVLGELSSQELTLSMAEASSISNVRVINSASKPNKISPRLIMYLFVILFVLIAYAILLVIHFLGDKITNYDSLVDYVSKEKIIGELPLIDKKENKKSSLYQNVADELLNKTIYEITNDKEHGNTYCIVSSRKGAGKTELSLRLFEKLKKKYKVCLLDLDYRKKGLTKILSQGLTFKSFDEFTSNKNRFISENDSLFVPSLDVESPPDFFTSEEFKNYIFSLKKEFDYVICDTPPWRLFIDAKIISTYLDKHIYVVCNQISSFKDIDIFLKDLAQPSKVKFFYNKFRLYFNFLWYKYQYPYYSRNYYYDYQQYSDSRKNLKFNEIAVKFASKIYNSASKWITYILKRLRNR